MIAESLPAGFAGFIGQAPAVSLLRRMIGSDRLPHGLMLFGPAGVGKTTLARLFAAALFCEQLPDDACGRCRSCTRLAHLNHPDFLYVTRPPKKDSDRDRQVAALATGGNLNEDDLKTVITVDQIRELPALGKQVGIGDLRDDHLLS